MLCLRAKNFKDDAVDIEGNQHLARCLYWRIERLKLSIDMIGLGSRFAEEYSSAWVVAL